MIWGYHYFWKHPYPSNEKKGPGICWGMKSDPVIWMNYHNDPVIKLPKINGWKPKSWSFGSDDILVGGFLPTHLKNMRKSNWIISRGRFENKKYLKLPPIGISWKVRFFFVAGSEFFIGPTLSNGPIAPRQMQRHRLSNLPSSSLAPETLKTNKSDWRKKIKWSAIKTLMIFHRTGWFIGILLLAYYNLSKI